MFVVLGASGNTGKIVAETLLRQKKKVRVVLHDAANTKTWGEAGADVAIADIEEGARARACLQRRGGRLRPPSAELQFERRARRQQPPRTHHRRGSRGR